MKKLFIFLIGCALGAQSVSAQININVNLGAQPQWGPAGYNHVDYYYLPDIQTYYSVPKRKFIYLNNGDWIFSNSLPSSYSGYNLYSGYKVVLNTVQPYRYFDEHKVRYAKYKGVKGQQLTLRGKANGKSHSANKGGKARFAGSNGKQSVALQSNGFKTHGGGKSWKAAGQGQGNGNNKGKNQGGGKGKH